MRKLARVGIISQEGYRHGALAIAKVDYTPGWGEPEIRVEPLQSMARVIGSETQAFAHHHAANPRLLAGLEQLASMEKQPFPECSKR